MVYQLQYLDYKDLATGKTLVVTPGSAYTIALAPGRNAAAPAYPNDGRWTSTSSFTAMETGMPIVKNFLLLPPALKIAADTDTPDKSKEGA